MFPQAGTVMNTDTEFLMAGAMYFHVILFVAVYLHSCNSFSSQ